MDTYELLTSTREKIRWPGSSPQQAVANCEAARDVTIVAWRTTWAGVTA